MAASVPLEVTGMQTPTTDTRASTPYGRAELGLPNYWYPVCGVLDIPRRVPKRVVVCGEPIALVKRGDTVYAVIDECPHRGARLSLGKDEFPGTHTLACRFHGWTYDLRDGRCVAALTDGPDSPVVGKVRIRTFPAQVRKGIVWLWMGRGAPVPVEDDIPALMLRPDTMVLSRRATVYGNWRYHAEGNAGGHAQMLHKDAVSMLFYRHRAYYTNYSTPVQYDEADKKLMIYEAHDPVVRIGTYPGLGSWPEQRPWRRQALRVRVASVQGARALGVALPGYLRVPNFPMTGAIYYEWYVPINRDHYTYFQATAMWADNPLARLWRLFWYHVWAAPMRNGRFNDQDKGIVGASTDYGVRHGPHGPAPDLYRPDRFPTGWIGFVNGHARGQGTEVAEGAGAQQAVAG